MSRPAADAHEFRQRLGGQICGRSGGRLPVEEGAQGDLAARVPEFRQGHRAQPETADPPGARMAGLVVGWDGGAGQDELTRRAPLVNGAPDVIPEDRSELPFVNQSGCLSRENKRWIHGDRLVRRPIHIQQHLARRRVPAGFGLSAGPCAFEQDGARGGQPVREFPVRDAGTVVSGLGQGAAARGASLGRKLTHQPMVCNDYSITFAIITAANSQRMESFDRRLRVDRNHRLRPR